MMTVFVLVHHERDYHHEVIGVYENGSQAHKAIHNDMLLNHNRTWKRIPEDYFISEHEVEPS